MKITVLGGKSCTYCKQAIQYLAMQGRSFEYLDKDEPENFEVVEQIKSEGASSIPQIWFDEERIGGFDQLKVRLG